MMNVPLVQFHSPPGPIRMQDMEVNIIPPFRPKQLLGPAFYAAIAVLFALIWTYSVSELITNESSLIAFVAFFYLYSLVSAARAYRAHPVRIPSMYHLNSLTCIRHTGFSSLADRLLAADELDLVMAKTDINKAYTPHMQIQMKGGFPDICRACNIVRPPRTYHCNSCRRCVYRLDHHSRLLGQCVHYRNAKYFTLAAISLFFSALPMVPFQTILTFRMMSNLVYRRELTCLTWLHLFLESSLIAVIGFAIRRIFVDAHRSYFKNSLKYERNPNNGCFRTHGAQSALDNIRSSIGQPIWKWLLPIDCTDPESVIHETLKNGNLFPGRRSGDAVRHVVFNGRVNQWSEDAESIVEIPLKNEPTAKVRPKRRSTRRRRYSEPASLPSKLDAMVDYEPAPSQELSVRPKIKATHLRLDIPRVAKPSQVRIVLPYPDNHEQAGASPEPHPVRVQEIGGLLLYHDPPTPQRPSVRSRLIPFSGLINIPLLAESSSPRIPIPSPEQEGASYEQPLANVDEEETPDDFQVNINISSDEDEHGEPRVRFTSRRRQ